MKKYAVLVVILGAIGGGSWYFYDHYWEPSSSEVTICSFNIQFLGHFTKKDNETLADILKDFDIVVVQELVAPPTDGTYPDGEAYSADPQASEFFQAMQAHEFAYKLSEEDTGTGDEIHKATSATEWWVTFFKPNLVEYAEDLPNGFLADDRSNHDDFERVPYAFAFRTLDGNLDFVLVSVHLKPGDSSSDQARRLEEFTAIAGWIAENDMQEEDFIILGDMNIKDEAELLSATPEGFVSLNDECYATNTNLTNPKPYDHVMYQPLYTTEIDTIMDIHVIDLVETVRPYWVSTDVDFPGDPYDHNLFRQYYSDHNPIVFTMVIPEEDDD